MSFSFSHNASMSSSTGRGDDSQVLHMSHVDYLLKLRHVGELSKRALRRHMSAHPSSSSSQHLTSSTASTSLSSSLQRSAEVFGLHSSVSSSAAARVGRSASIAGSKPADSNVVPPVSRLALATSHALSERYAVYSSGATYPASISEGNFHAYYYFYNHNSQQRSTGSSAASSEANRDYEALMQSMSFTLFPYSGNHIAHSLVDSRLETLRSLLYSSSHGSKGAKSHHALSASLGSVPFLKATTLIARPPTSKHGVLSHAERKHLVEALRIMDELITVVQKPVSVCGGTNIALDVSTAATSTLLAQLYKQRAVLLKFLGLVLEEVDDNRSAAKRLLHMERERMSVNMSTFDEALSGALCCVANAVTALMEDFPFAIASPLAPSDTQLRPSHMSYAYSLCFDAATILDKEFHCLDVAAGYYELAALIVSLSLQESVPIARNGAKCRMCGGTLGPATAPAAKDVGNAVAPSDPIESGSPQAKQSKRERFFGRIGGAFNKLRVSANHGDQIPGAKDVRGKSAGEDGEGIRSSDTRTPTVEAGAAQTAPSPLLIPTGSFSGEVTSPISSSFTASPLSSSIRGGVLCSRCARTCELNSSPQRPVAGENSEAGDELNSQDTVLLPPSDGNQTDSVHIGMTGMFADAMIAAATACAVGGDCGRARVLALDALRQLDRFRRTHLLDTKNCTAYPQRCGDVDAFRRIDPSAPLPAQRILQHSLEKPLDAAALSLQRSDVGPRSTDTSESGAPAASPSGLSFTVVMDPTPDSVSTVMHQRRVLQQTDNIPHDAPNSATPMEDLNALLATTTDRLHALLLVFFIDAWWEKPAFQHVKSEPPTTGAEASQEKVRTGGNYATRVVAELRAMAEEYRYHERRLGTFLPPYRSHSQPPVNAPTTEQRTQPAATDPPPAVETNTESGGGVCDADDVDKRRERRRTAFHSFLSSPFASLEFEKLDQDDSSAKPSSETAQRIPTSYYCTTSPSGAATANQRRVKTLSMWSGEAMRRCTRVSEPQEHIAQQRPSLSTTTETHVSPVRPASTRFSQLVEQLVVVLEAFAGSHTNELVDKLSSLSSVRSCDAHRGTLMDALNQTLTALGVRTRDLLILAQRAVAIA